MVISNFWTSKVKNQESQSDLTSHNKDVTSLVKESEYQRWSCNVILSRVCTRSCYLLGAFYRKNTDLVGTVVLIRTKDRS